MPQWMPLPFSSATCQKLPRSSARQLAKVPPCQLRPTRGLPSWLDVDMWKLSQKRLFHTMGELQEQRPETTWDRLRLKARMFLKQPNLAKEKLESKYWTKRKKVVQPIVCRSGQVTGSTGTQRMKQIAWTVSPTARKPVTRVANGPVKMVMSDQQKQFLRKYKEKEEALKIERLSR